MSQPDDFEWPEPDFPEPIDGVFSDVSTAEIIPPTWIIEDLLPVGLTFIGGPPKAHKSGVTLAITALAAGRPCKVLPKDLSKAKLAGKTLAFSYEASAGVIRHTLENEMGVKLQPHDMLVADDPFTWRLDDPRGKETLLKWCDELKPRILILDPLRDLHNLKEQDSGEMNRLLRPLQQWAIANQSAVVIVHHAKKIDDERTVYRALDMRGTSAFFALADCVLMLSPLGSREDVFVHIEATFKRGTPWERDIQLAAYDHQDRIAGDILDEFTQKVLKCKMDNPDLTQSEIAAKLGKANAKVVESMRVLRRNGLIKGRDED